MAFKMKWLSQPSIYAQGIPRTPLLFSSISEPYKFPKRMYASEQTQITRFFIVQNICPSFTNKCPGLWSRSHMHGEKGSKEVLPLVVIAWHVLGWQSCACTNVCKPCRALLRPQFRGRGASNQSQSRIAQILDGSYPTASRIHGIEGIAPLGR